MRILYAYLAAGVCVSTGFLLWRMRGDGVATNARTVAGALAAILVGSLLWPVFLYLKAREKLGDGNETADIAETRFTVPPRDLLKPCTVAEVERVEQIEDPLDAVPHVPFGHLYPAWLRFKTRVPPGASLWAFESNWTSNWGRRDHRRGYVVVDAYGRIGEHFIAEVERLTRPD